jgi:hypothetical protein
VVKVRGVEVDRVIVKGVAKVCASGEDTKGELANL